ncbi:MAG: hypothetical protein EXS00_05590 [Phycisphaerales bacterium]|nr:hypothetical protein [Phycisphaerales bacterium]
MKPSRAAPVLDPHEATLVGQPLRRSRGSFYTPPALVSHILDGALASWHKRGGTGADSAPDFRVCDPACGTGRFLVEAARRLAVNQQGELDRGLLRRVTEACIWGVDVDAEAVRHCRENLWSQCGDGPMPREFLLKQIVCGDALGGAPSRIRTQSEAEAWLRTDSAGAERPFHWGVEFPRVFSADSARSGFDLVVGNPPFLSQLKLSSARTTAAAARLRRRFGPALSRYADQAGAFLLLALELAAQGGTIAMVQPHSLLAALDSRGVREAMLKHCRLQRLWVANGRVFPGASVFVCAPVFRKLARTSRRASKPAVVMVTSGCDLERRGGLGKPAPTPFPMDSVSTWSYLGAASLGVPILSIGVGATISEIADVTADFRDEYYGLRGSLVEDADVPVRHRHRYPPLVTVGLIDLARCKWGQIPCRIHKQQFAAPRVDRRQLDSDGLMGKWMRRRLKKKILVATQTRMIEVFVDDTGKLLPSTPLLSVVPSDPRQLWMIAAAIASPVLCALALSRYSGSALHCDAIKLSASQLRGMPLPIERSSWRLAAESLRRAHRGAPAQHLVDFARHSCRSYGLDAGQSECVFAWWTARLQIGERRSRRATPKELES